jgi:diacylglycerol kinase (ATP)
VSGSERFNLAARARSFGHAFRGIAGLVASQHNARIHAVATLGVVGLGFALGVSPPEWALLLLAIASVWVAEGFNTALELLCDAVSRERHPLVGKAKDVAAGAVLIAALLATGVGLLVLGPRLLGVLSGPA